MLLVDLSGSLFGFNNLLMNPAYRTFCSEDSCESSKFRAAYALNIAIISRLPIPAVAFPTRDGAVEIRTSVNSNGVCENSIAKLEITRIVIITLCERLFNPRLEMNNAVLIPTANAVPNDTVNKRISTIVNGKKIAMLIIAGATNNPR